MNTGKKEIQKTSFITTLLALVCDNNHIRNKKQQQRVPEMILQPKLKLTKREAVQNKT